MPEVARCKITDIFTIEEPLPPEDEAALTEYLSHFVAPVKNEKPGMAFGLERCFKCDKALSGFLGTFEWGIAHGEGRCGECGWPARAYHRNVGPLESLTFILQYHPDEVETKPDCEVCESAERSIR